ncbi:Glutamate receptor 2.3 [Camellia lanceoleosa]|uniref:Glutamate receptor 2.3 n=1 Tax=Camellia lanceoleosa TaxID=1840588 RepID=A0ACC0ICY4_9ERIC|nr:Glutamate receptor 2.3 [Camellia lanceoleosa]
MENFDTIIWPGGSTNVPKGWEFPVSGEKLRIAVPVRGFNQFVKVEIDPHTNATIFGGFCIEIFKSVISALPYAVRYEFVPFEIADGSSFLSYNDMVCQVSLQELSDVYKVVEVPWYKPT